MVRFRLDEMAARLHVVLAVSRRRLLDRWRAWRSGRTRRWDVALPPPGAPPGIAYVLVRGSTTPMPRYVAGDEYEPVAESRPLVAWTRSVYWSRRERDDPYAWHPTELPPSLRTPRRPR